MDPGTERTGPRPGSRPDTTEASVRRGTDTAPNALYLGPPLSEDAPAAVREGIVRRRLCFTAGACPCGAVLPRPNRAQRRAMARDGGLWRVTLEHEDGCPAIAPEVVAWLRSSGSRHG